MAIQTTWNLTPLFKSDTDPRIAKNQKETAEEIQKFVKKWQGKTDYLKDPQILKKALDEYENLMHFYGVGGDANFYFSLRESLDETNTTVKAKSNQIIEALLKNLNLLQFLELNLAKVDKKIQPKFLQDPGLQNYQHFLEKIFANSAYVLSDAEEKIINLKSQPARNNWIKMTSSFLTKEEREVIGEDGKKQKLSFSEVMNLIGSKKKRVRDDAAKALNDILGKHVDVAVEELNSLMADHKIDDDLRGFTRPDAERLLHDDMDPKTVDVLLEAVTARNDLAIRYYKLKAKLFGVKKLDYQDRNVDYGEVDLTFTFAEAHDLVGQIFNRLDPEFLEIYDKFWKNGQVDVYPKKGKTSGAFCANESLVHPTYILLNFDKKLSQVMTIAHEFGHGINSELMRQKQNALNFHVPTSTAEVASVFMEDFVLEDILKKANDEQKLAILMNKLNEEISTTFRQAALYRFEQEIHSEFRKKGYLPKEELGKIFLKHMSAYMGPAVKQNPGSENWWVYWSHIRQLFYVYAYVQGQLIGKGLQSLVRKDPKNIEGVKGFLAAGTSKSPKNIFMELGIDITKRKFWDSGLMEIEETLKETEKLAKKLGKI